MGCGGGKDAKITAELPITVKVVQTGIMEFDQIFLILAETLDQAEDIRQNVIPGRYNMIRISKAHLLADPSICDAYKLWLQGVSLCNKGKSKDCKFQFDQSKRTFTYNLGDCGEVRFDWFGDYLNDFYNGVHRANEAFPKVKERIDAMFDRVKAMKDQAQAYVQFFPSMTEKIKAIALVAANLAQIGFGMKVADEFQKQLERYIKEIDELLDKHDDWEKKMDDMGEKISHRYPPVLLDKMEEKEPDRYRLGCKMNIIVDQYYNDQPKRSLEEQNEDTEKKAERAKNKPRKNKTWKPNDLPWDKKSFPQRLRWVGCNVLDLPMQEMSVALEEHQTQKAKLKQYKRLLSFKLNLHVLKDQTLYEAWRIFCWKLLAEKSDAKIEFKDEKPFLIGLDKMSFSGDMEEVRQFFMELVEFCAPPRREPLDAMWQDFQDKISLLKNWSAGEFTNYPAFKQAKIADQYNMMSNVAKNIYALRAYKPAAEKIYKEKYAKLKKQSEEFWVKGPEALQEAKDKSKEVKGTNISKIAEKHHEGQAEDKEKQMKQAAKAKLVYKEFKAGK